MFLSSLKLCDTIKIISREGGERLKIICFHGNCGGNMGRTHRSFLIIIKLIFVLALVASFNACSSEDRTKLEMPNFTSFYIGTDETLPSSEVVPTTTNVRPMIPYLLQFTRWEKAKLSDPDAFDLRFVLIDDQETTYYFSDY